MIIAIIEKSAPVPNIIPESSLIGFIMPIKANSAKKRNIAAGIPAAKYTANLVSCPVKVKRFIRPCFCCLICSFSFILSSI